jgi:hypothetical protein
VTFDPTDAESNGDLDALSRRYAAAMDQRDRNALLSVFDADASMLVKRPGREPGTMRGHAELGRLVEIIARWPRTVHVVTQGRYTIQGDVAHGEVRCTAHHFDSLDESRDHLMHIVYRDRYRFDHHGGWHITHRTVAVEATEDRQSAAPPST